MEHDDRTIGLLGTGLLGTALGERLLMAGFTVHAYNRTRSHAEQLLQHGAHWSDNPFSVCNRVLVCLFTTEIVEQVLTRLGGMHPGQIIIDCTTGDPHQVKELATSLTARGIQYLEAPIAASSEQTRRGEAIAIVSGPQELSRQCTDITDAFAQKTFYVGECGNAAKVKLVNNLFIGLHRAVLAEGLSFAHALDLPLESTLEFLRQSNAYSSVMDTKGAKMLSQDFSPQAKLSQHLKDVRIILSEAQQNGLELPLSILHEQLLNRLTTMGYGGADNSAIIKAFGTAPVRNSTTPDG